MQWMMLQQDVAGDFVIAMGVQYSVRAFITWTAAKLGITLDFIGTGVKRIATVTQMTGDQAPSGQLQDVLMKIDQYYFRPAEVETLLSDPTKAKTKLSWVPEITAQRHALLWTHGYDVT